MRSPASQFGRARRTVLRRADIASQRPRGAYAPRTRGVWAGGPAQVGCASWPAKRRGSLSAPVVLSPMISSPGCGSSRVAAKRAQPLGGRAASRAALVDRAGPTSDAPQPPPAGLERRGRERLMLEARGRMHRLDRRAAVRDVESVARLAVILDQVPRLSGPPTRVARPLTGGRRPKSQQILAERNRRRVSSRPSSPNTK